MIFASVIAMIKQRRLELAKILIVFYFADAFLDKVLGVPPIREVEFVINLVLDTTLISREPYHMASLSLGISRSNCMSCQIRGLSC